MTSPSGESRGGTPVGERIPKGMRAVPDGMVVVEQRFPAFRFLFLSWLSRFVIAGKSAKRVFAQMTRPSMQKRGMAQSTGQLSKLQISMDHRSSPVVTRNVCRCLTSSAADSEANALRERERLLHLSPCAGRGRESEATEGERALPQVWVKRQGPLILTFSPRAGRRDAQVSREQFHRPSLLSWAGYSKSSIDALPRPAGRALTATLDRRRENHAKPVAPCRVRRSRRRNNRSHCHVRIR